VDILKLPGKWLTSKQTARLLGVSEASVKRWADGGLLPAEKTAGGHRRFRPEDVAAFRRRKLGRASRPDAAPRDATATADTADFEAAAPGVADDEALARALFEMLKGGRAEEASSMLVGLYLRGRGVASLVDGVLCPAMRRVGDLWYAGVLTIAQEHAAARAALATVEALRAAVGEPESAGPVALCCAVEEDFHELPVQLAAVTLRAAGWEVFNLGPHLPFFSLAEAVGQYRPRLVCVSATIFRGPDRAAREYEELRTAAARAGASVVLGGAGFKGEGARTRFPAELHAESFGDLEAFAVRLASEQAQAV
jgi:excisionase family DNA binding protein